MVRVATKRRNGVSMGKSVKNELRPRNHTNLDARAMPQEPLGPDSVLRSMDRCTKCGICQAYCPVAAATDSFPGPKYTGPQAQRFRAIDPTKDLSPALCSGCGVCTSVCPNDVAITDIIAIAKARMVGGDDQLPIRQRLLNRPDLIGRMCATAPAIANMVLENRTLRALAHKLIGVHREAPLPRVAGRRFRRWLDSHPQTDGPTVSYFSGCAVEFYDADVGIAAVEVLSRLGLRVDVPTDKCCGLPMLSSGEWDAGRRYADAMVSGLSSTSESGNTIVSTSTSCSLTLRSKYAAYFGLTTPTAKTVADRVVDICEFLLDKHAEGLADLVNPLPARAVYHGPCQLRGHKMGMPAVELLQLIPKLSVDLSQADCCGIAGTYGYDRDKHEVAMAVAKPLTDRIADLKPDLVVCDSETCRWHIEKLTGVPCRHPIEVIRASIEKVDPLALKTR